MKPVGASKNGLFLMELLAVIVLFAICAAICLQMFAYASVTAKNAQTLSYGSMAADSVAACYQAYDGDLLGISSQIECVVTNDSLQVYYDQNWQTVSSVDEAGCYQLTCEKTGNTGLITVIEYGTDDPVYTLCVQVTGGGGYA